MFYYVGDFSIDYGSVYNWQGHQSSDDLGWSDAYGFYDPDIDKFKIRSSTRYDCIHYPFQDEEGKIFLSKIALSGEVINGIVVGSMLQYGNDCSAHIGVDEDGDGCLILKLPFVTRHIGTLAECFAFPRYFIYKGSTYIITFCSPFLLKLVTQSDSVKNEMLKRLRFFIRIGTYKDMEVSVI